MVTSVSHIALFVPDLQEAEKFYMNLFDMELIGREIEKENGLWFTLPFNKGWEDAKAAGIDLDMNALRNGNFVLALFRGDNPSGQVYVIGLNATQEDIKTIHKKISSNVEIEDFQADRLEFIDPYHITWQIAVEPVFRTSGDFTNRWIII
jgi:catechol 2,3-dioxygenase-like lactoylglutathione lyase family enzyme